jgi:ankyrin repeat protein
MAEEKKKKPVDVEIAGQFAERVVECLKECKDINLKRVLLIPILLCIAFGTYMGYQFILKQNNEKLLDPGVLRSLPDVKGLVEFGADPDYSSADTQTPLIVASEFGSADVVGFLLDHGATHSSMNFHGVTPLIGAVRAGNIESMRLLIEAGAPVDQSGLMGPPLQVAVGERNVNAIKLLLEGGAAVDTLDDQKHTALSRAEELGNLEIAELLLKHEAKVDGYSSTAVPLLLATQKYIAAKALGRTPPSGDSDSGSGEEASADGQPDFLAIIDLLLDNGANVNATGDDGRTALLLASRTGDTDLITYLLVQGADINYPAAIGTPLLLAARDKDQELVQFLVDKGADVNLAGADRQTALDNAIKDRDLSFARFLIGLGAGQRYLSESTKRVSGDRRVHYVLEGMTKQYPVEMNHMLNIEDGIEDPGKQVRVSGSMNLNGVNQYVEILEKKTELSTAKKVTVSVWVKRNKPDGVTEAEETLKQYILSRNGGLMLGFNLYIDGNNRLTWAVHDGTQQYSINTKARMLPHGRWMHVAATCGGGKITLFVNGHEVASGPAGEINCDGSGHLFVGRNSRSDSGHFAGELQNVAVYTSVLYTKPFKPTLMPARIKDTYLLLNVDAGKLRERYRTPVDAKL